MSGEAAEVLWRPSPERVDGSRLTAFAAEVRARYGVPVADYEALWRWSVEELEDFWALVWEFFGFGTGAAYEAVLAARVMPGARWFPGSRLNLAEYVLAAGPDDAGSTLDVAIEAVDETGPTGRLTWAELRAQVASVADTLRAMGVGKGDRVVGYLPNIPASVVAMLATASLGAVWSACAPDIGRASATDRFAQLEPLVLITVDGYRFGGKTYDRRTAVTELVESMPSLRQVIHVPVLDPDGDLGHLSATGRTASRWADAIGRNAELVFEPVAFDDPLWVVYSSGTTGLPKGLVHGHGGALLIGVVQQALQHDLGPGNRMCWHTTTSWIMWNFQVSALSVGATVVMYDGSPLAPDADRLWSLAETYRLSMLGTSPGHLLACAKAGLRPGEQHDLSALLSVGVTGSPLPASSYRWVYDAVKVDVALDVISGGTDFAAALVGHAAWLPVTAGEMAGRGLGIHVESWDAEGRPLVDEVGELVLLAPMPSMPLRIWGDEDGSRYRESYFEVYPGVWRHGDWITVTERGTSVVHGRSDSTLNRHGVRMGSADIYQAVEKIPEVAEALVLGVETAGGGYWLPLFVRLAPGVDLDEALTSRIKEAVRTEASPRHVPDEVIATPAIPHTTTGKKLEVPIKRIFQGVAPDKALNLGSVDSPDAVHWFIDLAAARAGQ
ncbi:MAG: acetoacetate--CoA ligase [Mycobacteriales bacterium]